MPQNEVVYLCPGEQHTIVCSTNQICLTWIIRFPSPHYSYLLRIYAFSLVGNHTLGPIGGATINYTKNSEPDVLPLISMLLMDPVTTSLNGTMITCYNDVYEAILTISIYVINGKMEFMQAAKVIYFIINFNYTRYSS